MAFHPYLFFGGTAADAFTRYQEVFGGELILNTFADFGRDDGAGDLIAHGMLQGPVELFAADAGAGEPTLKLEGVLFSLLGTAEPAVLEQWFAALADGGEVIDPLTRKPWGDHDGQVRDRFGITWLIGYVG